MSNGCISELDAYALPPVAHCVSNSSDDFQYNRRIAPANRFAIMTTHLNSQEIYQRIYAVISEERLPQAIHATSKRGKKATTR